MLPKTMNAIEIIRAGGPEVLVPSTRSVPQPEAGQVLIKVAYAGINRHDVGQRVRGHGPTGATDIPGLEVSDEVVATGSGAGERRRLCRVLHRRSCSKFRMSPGSTAIVERDG